jgi:hypothetical protein
MARRELHRLGVQAKETTLSLLAAEGRHRWHGLVLPRPPDDAETRSYAPRALAPLVPALFISAACIILSQALMEFDNFATPLPAAVNIQVNAAGAGSSGVRKDLGELF